MSKANKRTFKRLSVSDTDAAVNVFINGQSVSALAGDSSRFAIHHRCVEDKTLVQSTTSSRLLLLEGCLLEAHSYHRGPERCSGLPH